MDHLLIVDGDLADGGRQFRLQPRAGHLHDIHTGFPFGRLKELAGPTVDVDHVTGVIDDRAGRSVALMKDRLDKLQGTEFFGPLDSLGDFQLTGLIGFRRGGEVQHGVGRRRRWFAVKYPPLLVRQSKQVRGLTDRL